MIPHTFVNGTKAKSSEVNENFAFVGFNPVGSITAWHKSFLFNAENPITIVAVGPHTRTVTSYAVGLTYTNTGDWDNVDFVRFEQRINSPSRESMAYVVITYSDATTSQSPIFRTNSTSFVTRIYKNPSPNKEIDKIEVWHRIASANATSTIQNMSFDYGDWDNFTESKIGTSWVECNGQTLSDAGSVFNGLVIPDLNNPVASGLKGRFIRGNLVSGLIESSENLEHTHDIFSSSDFSNIAAGPHNASNSGHLVRTNSTSVSGGDESRPNNMSVVWIMRVK